MLRPAPVSLAPARGNPFSPRGRAVRIACSTASFPQDRLELAVTKVAWAGYDAVELALAGEEVPDAARLRDRLRAEELEVAAVCAGSLPPGPDAQALARL